MIWSYQIYFIIFSETEDNADIHETNEGSSLLQQVVAKRLQFEDGMFDHSPVDEDAESLLADHPNDTTTFGMQKVFFIFMFEIFLQNPVLSL